MSERGFTLFEFAVVVVCISLLAGLVLQRVVPLISLAERTAFEQVRGQLSSALLLAAAERIARGESATLAELAGMNPMELLLEPPGNYLGEFDRPDVEALGRRVWYFDSRERTVVYRPGAGVRLQTAEGAADRIALAVSFAYRDRNGDGRFDPAHDRFDGLSFDPLDEFAWAVD